MRLTLDCPRARYGEGMVIYCGRDNQPCAHQYFKACKGWYALSAGAASCPAREEKSDGESHAAAADGCHQI